MKRLLKPAVALVAVLGLLSVLAAPSAASTGTITGGTLTVNLVPPIVEPLGTGTTISCTTSSNAITALDDSTDPTTGGTPDTFSATRTGTITVDIHTLFDYNSETFEFIGQSIGRYTSVHSTTSNPYTLSLHFNFTGRIYRAIPGQDLCTSGTQICLLISNSWNFTGTGSFNPVHPAPIGTLHVSGSRAMTAFGCTAPFSAMNGKTATVASLTATLV